MVARVHLEIKTLNISVLSGQILTEYTALQLLQGQSHELDLSFVCIRDSLRPCEVHELVF